MVRVQTQNNWIQNYTEQCKMKKGTPVLADYGLQQDAATVEISPEGSRKATSYEYTNVNELAEEKPEVYEAGGVTEQSVDALIDTILSGGEVSAEEEERLNGELIHRIRMQYTEMYTLHLDESDEKVREALKKNYLMKQQALKDMKAAMEEERQEKEISQQEAETAQNAGAVANKAAEADMIEESLEGLGQETGSKVQGSFRQVDSELNNGKVSGSMEDNNTSEAENTSAQKKIMRYDEKNKGNIKAFDDQRLAEFEREKEYSHMLDDSYRMTMQVFENDNYSIKDKVDAYQSFMKDSKELAENREIERYLKIYDYHSATDLRIKTLSNQRIKTVAKTTENGQKKYVPVDNILRSVGQAMVEEAAKEKEKTKTGVDDLTKKKKEYIEAQEVEVLQKGLSGNR